MDARTNIPSIDPQLSPAARKFLEETTMKSIFGISDEALDAVMALAYQLYQVGRYDEAGVLCRGLIAADPLPHLDDHILAIGGIRRDERQAQLLLQAPRALLELGHELAQVGVLARRREIVTRGLPLLSELVRLLELLQAAPDVRRFAVVVVDGRIGHPCLQLFVVTLELRDEVVEVGRHGNGQG